jgi:hypothetical protein
VFVLILLTVVRVCVKSGGKTASPYTKAVLKFPAQPIVSHGFNGSSLLSYQASLPVATAELF